MNVSLTPELEQMIAAKVASGRYHTASEVVREGLRLIQHRDELHQKKLDALREDIRMGVESIEDGNSIDGEEFFEGLLGKETA